jgi:hypothetical protein
MDRLGGLKMWILTRSASAGRMLAEVCLASEKIRRYFIAQVEDGDFAEIECQLAGLLFDAGVCPLLLGGNLCALLLATGRLCFLLAAEGKQYQQQARWHYAAARRP